MPPLQPFVPNVPLQVAANLRFTDANGILVTQMLPIGMNGTVVADSPTTGYISHIGAALSTQIDLYNSVTNTLNNYANDIVSLQDAVSVLQISGATTPVVNGYCFNSNQTQSIITVTELIAQSACSYNSVLGTTTALTLAILAEGASTLNALPAFSQNSAMAGLAGWLSTPTTIADSINNSWLSYLDMRTGVSRAIAAVTPTCSQVMVNWMVNLFDFTDGFYLYFDGFTFIPTGFTDAGSQIRIYDGSGNPLIQSFDIVSQSTTPGPLIISTSGSTLSPTGTYTVYVDSNVQNTALNLTCQKTTVVANLSTTSGVGLSTIGTLTSVITGTGTSSCCPDKGTYTATYTSGTTSIPVITGLTYTPSFAVIQSGDSITATTFNGKLLYNSYVSGGANLNVTSSSYSGAVAFDWIAWR
jgi:hypothetical protein